MQSSRRHPLRRLSVTLLVLLLAAAAIGLTNWPTRGRPAARAMEMGLGHGPMTETAMRRWVIAYYGAHPARGERSTAAPSDSFFASNFVFDENGDGTATQVDTAKIFEGQTILWKLVTGSHTVTSGTGFADPQAGALFDQPLNSIGGATSFSFQFNTAGTYDFFCRPHEDFNMKGVVVVKSLVSVDPAPGAGLGFTRSPWPNPTRGVTAFRFALDRPGHARAEVYDVRGARVATVLDRDMKAGAWDAAWDGRASGHPAEPGVYYLRLILPGRTESRSIVVAR